MSLHKKQSNKHGTINRITLTGSKVSQTINVPINRKRHLVSCIKSGINWVILCTFEEEPHVGLTDSCPNTFGHRA